MLLRRFRRSYGVSITDSVLSVDKVCVPGPNAIKIDVYDYDVTSEVPVMLFALVWLMTITVC